MIVMTLLDSGEPEKVVKILFVLVKGLLWMKTGKHLR